MYDNVKYMGKTLKWWKDEVFKNSYTLGELFMMVKDGIKIDRLSFQMNE